MRSHIEFVIPAAKLYFFEDMRIFTINDVGENKQTGIQTHEKRVIPIKTISRFIESRQTSDHEHSSSVVSTVSTEIL